MTQTDRVNRILQALRAAAESDAAPGWRDVYLDNARPSDLNDKQFRAALVSLSKRGLYKPLDGYAFGMVRMTD